MMKSKMKQLTLAVGMALGGISLMPSAQAMNLATDGLGQVLIFPYYTVQEGWTTAFNVTNTSNLYVAARVRFHESYNSRDVFDFTVILSPNDVWNGWVARQGDGPAFYTQDNTCTSFVLLDRNMATEGVPFFAPNLGINGTLAYTGAADDDGPAAVNRMNEGYMEVIMMDAASLDPAINPGLNANAAALVRGAKHVDGIPPGCDALATAFLTYNGPLGEANFNSLLNVFNGVTPRVNPLKGSYNLVNGANGWTASGSPTTIANFSTASLLTSALAPSATVPFNRSYFEPTLNSGNQAAVGTGQFDVALPVAPGGIGINAVSQLLARTHVINQWSRITENINGWVTATDWVLTHPTKAFYVDQPPAGNTNPNWARTPQRSVVVAPTIPAVLPAGPTPFAANFTEDGSCVAVEPWIYNREEDPQLGAGISPGSAQQALCFETNVLTFGELGSPATNILDSAHPQTVTPLPGIWGYMDVVLTALNATNVPQGLPVIGFMITTRDTGDGALNEAFLVDHAYSRTIPPANP